MAVGTCFKKLSNNRSPLNPHLPSRLFTDPSGDDGT